MDIFWTLLLCLGSGSTLYANGKGIYAVAAMYAILLWNHWIPFNPTGVSPPGPTKMRAYVENQYVKKGLYITMPCKEKHTVPYPLLSRHLQIYNHCPYHLRQPLYLQPVDIAAVAAKVGRCGLSVFLTTIFVRFALMIATCTWAWTTACRLLFDFAVEMSIQYWALFLVVDEKPRADSRVLLIGLFRFAAAVCAVLAAWVNVSALQKG
jgi:hypothetical protein